MHFILSHWPLWFVCAAMVVAAALSLAGSLTALGYSRRPVPGAVAREGEMAIAPAMRLDPASPDCPACLVDRASRGVAGSRPEAT